MPKQPPPRRPPPSAPASPTEPSLPVVDDPAKTDESIAHSLAATDEEASLDLSLPPPSEPSMPAIASMGATDESVAHRPRGGGVAVPVRNGPVRRGSRREQKKGAPILAYASVLALLAFAGLIAWLKLSSSGPKVVGPTGAEKDAQASFQDAKNLIRQGNWKDAKVELDALATSAPDLEGLSGYVKAAQLEVPLQQHLDDAELAIVHGELSKAASELHEVPDASKQFFRRGELDAKLGKAVDDRLKEASPLAYQTKDKEKMRKLKALAEDMLAARPANRDAQQLLSLANSILDAKPIVEAPKDPGDPSARVMNEYAGGNTSGAFALAESCAASNAHCSELKKQISEVKDLFKNLETLEEGDLLHAVRLDRLIAGGKQSPSGKQAGVRLAAVLYPKASSAASRKQWGYALSAARRVLEGDPQHEGAHGVVSEAREAAQELYQRCYVGRAQSPEDALPLCKEVVAMLPEGDELRVKAQRILTGGAAP